MFCVGLFIYGSGPKGFCIGILVPSKKVGAAAGVGVGVGVVSTVVVVAACSFGAGDAGLLTLDVFPSLPEGGMVAAARES
jgi:hypothetical protein